MESMEHFQRRVWHLLYPVFPYIQLPFSIFHGGRQPYRIGWLAEGRKLEDLKAHLSRQGFGNHFIAWEDTGQVLSWRKLVDFNRQYHIRIFKDGEIRGHYELTPEAAPVRHFDEREFEDRREDFYSFLGEYLTLRRIITELEADIEENVSQITYTF